MNAHAAEARKRLRRDAIRDLDAAVRSVVAYCRIATSAEAVRLVGIIPELRLARANFEGATEPDDTEAQS